MNEKSTNPSSSESKPKEKELYPFREEVAAHACNAVLDIMSPQGTSQTGSNKSGPGEWYTEDWQIDPAYHYMRAIRHLTTAYNQVHGTEPKDREGPEGHLKRAITRATFCLELWKGKKI